MMHSIRSCALFIIWGRSSNLLLLESKQAKWHAIRLVIRNSNDLMPLNVLELILYYTILCM
jgi:hypothetical protein